MCRAEQADLNQLAEKYRDKVAFLGVSNQDTVAAGRAYARDLDVPYALAHGPEIWELFKIGYRPTTILFDDHGEIVEEIAGPVTAGQLSPLIDAELRSG